MVNISNNNNNNNNGNGFVDPDQNEIVPPEEQGTPQERLAAIGGLSSLINCLKMYPAHRGLFLYVFFLSSFLCYFLVF